MLAEKRYLNRLNWNCFSSRKIWDSGKWYEREKGKKPMKWWIDQGVESGVFLSRRMSVWLSTLLYQKTSVISPNNSISLSVGISTPAPGISKFNSNFNSSWHVELLMAHQNDYFGVNIVVTGLGYYRIFLPVISSRYLGRFTWLLLIIRENYQ